MRLTVGVAVYACAIPQYHNMHFATESDRWHLYECWLLVDSTKVALVVGVVHDLKTTSDSRTPVLQMDYAGSNAHTVVGIMFLEGATTDKYAPNACLVGCNREATSGEASDCPLHFLFQVKPVSCCCSRCLLA